MAWVVMFIVGVSASALILGNQQFSSLTPVWIGVLLLAGLFPALVKDRLVSGVGTAVSCLLLGILRYASAGTAGEMVLFPQIRDGLISAVSMALIEPHASFVNGLLVGVGKLPPELKAAFVATGTVHVMALSGWNLNVIKEYLGSGLKALPLSKPARLGILALFVVAFTLLTGAPLSLVRATVMVLATILAMAVGRQSSAGRAVFLAAALILLASPRSILSLSFLLSASATIGLVYLSPHLAPLFGFLPERWGIRANATATVAATFATLPIMLVSFGRLSLLALPANVLLLPFIPVTMFFGFLAGLGAIVFQPLGQTLGRLAWVFTNYDLSLVKLFSRIPGASVGGMYFNLAAGLVMSASLVGVAIYVNRKPTDEIPY